MWVATIGIIYLVLTLVTALLFYCVAIMARAAANAQKGSEVLVANRTAESLTESNKVEAVTGTVTVHKAVVQ